MLSLRKSMDAALHGCVNKHLIERASARAAVRDASVCAKRAALVDSSNAPSACCTAGPGELYREATQDASSVNQALSPDPEFAVGDLL